MSTDDLTARVRDHLAHADTLPRGLAIALLSELADEADRLRGELARTEQQIHEDNGFIDRIVDLEAENERLASIAFIHNGCETIRRKGVQAVLEQRDAARAALERVRAWVDGADSEVLHEYDWGWGYGAAVKDARNALEGES